MSLFLSTRGFTCRHEWFFPGAMIPLADATYPFMGEYLNFAGMAERTNNVEDGYLVIIGTNRKGGFTEKVGSQYLNILQSRGIMATSLDLYGLNLMERTDELVRIEKEILIPATKFIFIIPEYNGSYPGVLKLFLDDTDYQKVWPHKKALLTGIAKGRAGNLRGMDHLSDTLQFLKMTVHYNKLPISRVHTLFDDKGNLDKATYAAIEKQIDEFIDF